MTTRQLSFKGPPQLAIAAGASTPNPGIAGVQIWSTTANSILVWDGDSWEAVGSGGAPTSDSILAPLSFDTPVGTTATSDGYGGVGWDGSTPSSFGTGSAGTLDGSSSIFGTYLHTVSVTTAATFQAAGITIPNFRVKKGTTNYGGFAVDMLGGFTPAINGHMFFGVSTGAILFSTGPANQMATIGIGGSGQDDLSSGFRIYFGDGTTFNSSTWISRPAGTRNNPIYRMYLRVINGSNTAKLWLIDYGIAEYPEGISVLDNYSIDITSLPAGTLMEPTMGFGTANSTTARTFRTAFIKARIYKQNDAFIEQAANITGNAATADTLQTARTIQGVQFNGSANIDIITIGTTAPASPVLNQLWIQI